MMGESVTPCLQAIVIVLSIVVSFLVGLVLGYHEPKKDETLSALRVRIKELGEKSDQLLLFLSFAITAVVLLGYGQDSSSAHPVAQRIVQSGALRWLVSAIFPVVFGVFPLKEFQRDSKRWYRIVRWFKFWLLWVAILYIIFGARQLFVSI